MSKVGKQSAFHSFNGALLIEFEHIYRFGISTEIRKLLVCMEVMVSEDDVIQFKFSNDFFQPMKVVGKVFAFQSYFYADLIFIFLLQRTDAFHISR